MCSMCCTAAEAEDCDRLEAAMRANKLREAGVSTLSDRDKLAKAIVQNIWCDAHHAGRCADAIIAAFPDRFKN